ncbi:HPP family protein [Cyanobium sp. FGCU-52]|nr:HPP family protein [Cyanobium sp. FGCU52]
MTRPRQVAVWLATASFLAAITALGQLSGLRLLLFPELGAMASVLFGDPASPWARSPRLLLLTPLLAAVAGILVSRHLPFGPASVSLVLAAGLLLLRGLRSPVAPALSAGYLPVALGIHSWTYPLAILLSLAALVLLRRGRPGPAEPARFPPARLWLPPLLLFLAGALPLTQLLGSHLVLYPPLLVIGWETLAHGDQAPWRRRYAALLTATVAAAVVGLLLARSLGPVPLAAFLAALLTAWLLDRLRLPCPPAYAVALLPLVLPQPPLTYPLLVLVGGGWLVLVAWLSAAGIFSARRWRSRTEFREPSSGA